ncbi:Non-specific serine/threonine protein kinase protein [Dioscorea alata]|uniref:Non-specific serine/threonine protein kinase protein n=1 Tax=Dioscorea alata TaxID=55571 RepID=A0ACB7TVN6_DIOAL|nr:Non-specific serine/threonine protein kinase protein [Dioscorea alata]
MRPRAAAKLIPCLFLCLLIWSFFATLHCHALQPLDQSEVYALKKIRKKLRTTWNFSVDPCGGTAGWVDPTSNDDVAANVTCGACNTTSCHVTSIILKGQNLPGTLPDEFSSLTHLQVIDLTRNYLNGTIPTAWASLPLIKLSLLGNRINGSIPEELGGITTLQELILEDNQMQGPIPESLGNLINLERLLLSGNNFSGQLPKSLGYLTNLTDFRIDGNPISGKIPAFTGNWKKLENLYMVGTSLEGPFPSNFSALKALTELMVSPLIGGDGNFPPLRNMTNMHRLILRNISLSGELPDYIKNMKQLKTLDLSFNNLTGKIPDTFSSLKHNLQYLFLTNNKLTGEIPGWILNNNKKYDLSYNNFDSPNTLSECYHNGVNLVSSYSTSSNNIIPACFRKNYPCYGKARNYNLFINCGGGLVTVGEDEYQADIDTAGPSNYQSFNEKWAYSSTGYFVGKENQEYIVTNESALKSNVPNPELYMSARLNPLSLKYYGLCLQNGNYTVNLHFAEIVFTDKQTFASLGRRYFDVSIQGEQVLRDFNIAKEANGTARAITKSYNASVTNNTLEIHFQWAGKGTMAIPKRSVYGPLISAISVTPNFKPAVDRGNLSTGAILGIVAAACVLSALISMSIWCFWRRKTAENSELRGLELQTGYFTLRQIKAATGNFNLANKIGEGGFGPVYKGVLPDGSLIAVKQLSSKSRQGNREFVNEIGMISALNHPNLVKLFGCCIEGNQLLLVYEYMENNSLASALFGRLLYLHTDNLLHVL